MSTKTGEHVCGVFMAISRASPLYTVSILLDYGLTNAKLLKSCHKNSTFILPIFVLL